MIRQFQSPSCSLATLLNAIGVATSLDTNVRALTLDSREVRPGALFVALKGERYDGRGFIAEAIDKGAVAVLVDEDEPVSQAFSVPVVPVPRLAASLSQLAGEFYGNPSEKLNLIGVTGTNGKSTCVHLLAQMADGLGRKAASIGTLGVLCKGKTHVDHAMTTPDAIACQKALADLRANDVSTVAMEVSSHGLALARVAALNFRVAIFTNVSHDHLDFHGTLSAYAEAKSRLFKQPKLQFAVVNLDDDAAPTILAAVSGSAKTLTYSLRQRDADVVVTNLRYGELFTRFYIRSPWGEAEVLSALMGEFNVYNLVAIITTLCAQGASFSHVIELCEQLQPVPGRMQRITQAGTELCVIVDYAHTPDALENALRAVRAHTTGKVWCVFGCGGDRDQSKRAPMGAVAEALADEVIITCDNPRSENPESIVRDICAGFKRTTPTVEIDRAQAVQMAITRADESDVVLLAGKGHENYQILGTSKISFSDTHVAQLALTRRVAKNAKVGP